MLCNPLLLNNPQQLTYVGTTANCYLFFEVGDL